MPNIDVEENKEKFQKLCHMWIKRDGIDELLQWLETTDFYTAPASTRFHLMCEGGLCQHSINVFEQLCDEYKNEGMFDFKTQEDTQKLMESLAIIGLFHDVCKADFYKLTTRNVKDDYGNWTKVPYYSIENQGILVGHGYKSARIVNKYMNITDEEYMAILHHMGYSADDNIANVSEIFGKSKLTVLLHIADTKATFLTENVNYE